MKNSVIIHISVIALGFCVAYGSVPQVMTYQGLLTDDTGSPVADGNYSLTFRLYDAATGGTAQWTEDHSSVSIAGGLFKLLLGQFNPIDIVFDAPYWLEVQIGSGSPQSPRIELSSVPYSFSATTADVVDGFDASSSPMANMLLALDGTGKFPASALPSVPPGGVAGGDLTGTYPNPAIAADAVNSSKIQDGQVQTADIQNNAVTAGKIAPDIVSSLDGVSNDGGDIDLVAGTNVTITPNDGANTITIAASGGGGGDITAVWAGDGLSGGGDQGDVTLSVANPLNITGGANGVIAGYNTNGPSGWLGTSDHGVVGSHGNGHIGRLATPSQGAWGISSGGSWGALGQSTYGVYGFMANASSDHAAWLQGDAYIDGFLHVTGNLSKGSGSFLIDHPLDPENKFLRHNFVESPENLLIYRGRTQLNADGEGAVEMPEYFEALTREDEASIHLTPVGRPFDTGAEWNPGFRDFTVYGEPGRNVFWAVFVDRDDPVMHQLARPVEEEKTTESKLCRRGRLLYPTAYGYPESMGAHFDERREPLVRYEDTTEKPARTENPGR